MGRFSRKKSKSQEPLSEINVTPLVDVMLVLLIIFMVAAGVQNIEIRSERQEMQELAQEKLEEAEELLSQLEEKLQQKNTQVPIDLPKVDTEPVKLAEVQKLKLLVNDDLAFYLGDTLLFECLKVSPKMGQYLGAKRKATEAEGEQKAFEPCLKQLGEKLVDNRKLQEDQELYVLASRNLHYGQVLRIMASVRQAGVTKFGLVAEEGILGDAEVQKSPKELP